jgi:hypothetical protein
MNCITTLLAFFVPFICFIIASASEASRQQQQNNIVLLGRTNNSIRQQRSILVPSRISTARSADVVFATVPRGGVGGGQPSTKGRLTNLADRVGAAIALLGGLFLLVQYTGKNGLIALVFLLQWSMFYETCKVVEDHYRATSGIQSLKRQTFQKWWWFATIVLATSFRSLVLHSDTAVSLLGIDAHAVDFIAYVMTVVGLVNGVMGMAIHRAAGPDMFRIHLAKMAAYHFALVRILCYISQHLGGTRICCSR